MAPYKNSVMSTDVYSDDDDDEMVLLSMPPPDFTQSDGSYTPTSSLVPLVPLLVPLLLQLLILLKLLQPLILKFSLK